MHLSWGKERHRYDRLSSGLRRECCTIIVRQNLPFLLVSHVAWSNPSLIKSVLDTGTLNVGLFYVALSIASIRCLTLRSATRATTGKTRSTRTITKHVRPVLTEALNLQTIATTSLVVKGKERNKRSLPYWPISRHWWNVPCLEGCVYSACTRTEWLLWTFNVWQDPFWTLQSNKKSLLILTCVLHSLAFDSFNNTYKSTTNPGDTVQTHDLLILLKSIYTTRSLIVDPPHLDTTAPWYCATKEKENLNRGLNIHVMFWIMNKMKQVCVLTIQKTLS